MILFFPHKTLWLMMMYHQTKFGCKRISTSEDVIETVKQSYSDYMNHAVTLTLKKKQKELISQYDTLFHDNKPPYQVCLHKVEQFKRYCLDKIHTDRYRDSNSPLLTLMGVEVGVDYKNKVCSLCFGHTCYLKTRSG